MRTCTLSLHAVGSRVPLPIRHLDDAGVDAQIHEDGRLLADDSIRTSFALHGQLKATRVAPIEQNGRFSYSLRIKNYNELRETRLESAQNLGCVVSSAESSRAAATFGRCTYCQEVCLLG